MKHPNILMWKWGSPETGSSLYGASNTKVPTADHVNRMASMIRRNWPAFNGRLICITDDAQGIKDDIEIVPIWDDLAQYGRCFRRLKVFAPEMAAVLGDHVVSIDLDTVILRDIAPLFESIEEPFKIWRIGRESKSEMCGSLFSVKIGVAPDLFHSFNPDIALNLRKTHGLIGSDQAWMAYALPPDTAGWTKADGIFSFRYHLDSEGKAAFMPSQRRILARQQALRERMLKAARIVFFHGPEFDPSMTHLHLHNKWIATNWR